MDKYGFVYIWFDRKHKRYYVGSHWGSIDDGYICSSKWMRNAYKRRPEDFNRKIIKLVEDRTILYEQENFYLNMIKDHELGKKYYNLSNKAGGHWHLNETTRKIVGEKVSLRAKGRLMSDEAKSNIRAATLKNGPERGKKISSALTGRIRSDEEKKAISDGRKAIMTEEFRKKMGAATLGCKWSKGGHSEEAKLKIGIASKERKRSPMSDETKKKMSDSKKGKPPNNKGKKRNKL